MKFSVDYADNKSLGDKTIIGVPRDLPSTVESVEGNVFPNFRGRGPTNWTEIGTEIANLKFSSICKTFEF